MGSGAIQTSETIPTWLTYITIALVATAGTAFAMWIGERITEKGIGNGISMLIFVGIASRLLPTVINFFTQVFNGAITFWLIPVAVVLVAVLVGCLTLVDLGERRVPVQYAKRVVGRKMYGGPVHPHPHARQPERCDASDFRHGRSFSSLA